jgi:hypothetical protein
LVNLIEDWIKKIEANPKEDTHFVIDWLEKYIRNLKTLKSDVDISKYEEQISNF